ncbi:MAG: extracellular solute-binding protein [Pleomorphochaeta sp.]
MNKIITITIASLLACSSIFAGGTSETAANTAENQQLVIYTNSGGEGRAEWLTEKAKENGFDIAVVQAGGSEIANRLIAEKNNGQADLVFGLNNIEYEKLKKDNLLMQYRPTWADNFDVDAVGDPEGYYYPIVVQPLVTIINQDFADQPSDYLDLLDPKYNDQYNIFNLAGGTGKTIFASILVRYQDPNGELGISDEGWKVAKEFIQNAHMLVDGEDYIGNVIDGTRPMSELWGSGVIQNQNERNVKFDIMSPEIGVPYVVEQVAIISSTDSPNLAKEFASWFGSTEVQSQWSAKFGTIPADPVALESVTDDIKEFMGKIHPQTMNWSLIATNIDAWTEKAELEFVL